MRIFLLILLLPLLAFGDVNARNGIAITTASTINGITPIAAVNGQTVVSGEFNPGDLPDLKLWLVADNVSGSDGDAVTTWTDSSGNGNDATQGTAANKPTIQVAEVNGHRAVLFDGVNDYIGGGLSYSFTAQSVFIVTKWNGGGGSFSRIITFSDAGNDYDTTNHLIPLLRDDSTSSFGSWQGSAIRSAATITSGNWFTWASINSGSVLQNYLDGVANASSYSASWSKTWTRYNLGAQAQVAAPDSFFSGLIAEIIVIGREATPTERTDIQTYFETKYGL